MPVTETAARLLLNQRVTVTWPHPYPPNCRRGLVAKGITWEKDKTTKLGVLTAVSSEEVTIDSSYSIRLSALISLVVVVD